MFKKRKEKQDEEIRKIIVQASKEIREERQREIEILRTHTARAWECFYRTLSDEQKELYQDFADEQTRYVNKLNEK